jgi:hypothetical protein
MRLCGHCALAALVLTVGLARGDGPGNADEGKRAFAAGVILLQDPDGAKYEEAIVQFRRAYELVGSWKILGNIGLCALKLERDGEAIEAYEKYLEGGKKEIAPDERAQVERDLVALRAQIARAALQLPSPSGTLIDERMDARGTKIINRYNATTPELRLGLHPGEHVLTFRGSNGDSKWEVSLEPKASVSHRFEMKSAEPPSALKPAPEPARSSGSATAGYVIGGVGVAGLVVGSIFGFKTLSKKGERDDVCSNGTCTDPKGPQLDEEARQAATISTVAMGVGLVGVGVGAWLVLSKPSSPSTTAKSVWLAPQVSSAGARLTLGGSL